MNTGVIDPARVSPRSHRLVVELTPLLPPGEFALSDAPPPPAYYHPLEVPAYVRERLLAFLKGITSVPPAFLDGVLPRSEIAQARRLFRELTEGGLEEGEALLTMGVITKPPPPAAATLSVGRVLSCSCDDIKEEYVLVRSSAGERLDDRHRIVRCVEAFAATTARTAASVKEEEAAGEARRRAAFARARSFRVA